MEESRRAYLEDLQGRLNDVLKQLRKRNEDGGAEPWREALIGQFDEALADVERALAADTDRGRPAEPGRTGPADDQDDP